jgi:hypothetical protein
MFVNRAAEQNGDGVRRGWREPHNTCSSPDMITVITSRRMSWTGHVACIGIRVLHTRYANGSDDR